MMRCVLLALSLGVAGLQAATIGTASISSGGPPIQSCAAFAGCTLSDLSGDFAESLLTLQSIGVGPAVAGDVYVQIGSGPNYTNATGQYDSFTTYFLPGVGTGTINATVYAGGAGSGVFSGSNGSASFTLGSSFYNLSGGALTGSLPSSLPSLGLHSYTGAFTLGTPFQVGYSVSDSLSGNPGDAGINEAAAGIVSLQFLVGGVQVSPAASTPEPSTLVLALCAVGMGSLGRVVRAKRA